MDVPGAHQAFSAMLRPMRGTRHVGPVVVLMVALLPTACKKEASQLPPKMPKPLPEAAQDAEVKAAQTSPEEELPWAPQTFSPQPGSTPEPFLEKAEASCGKGDAALHEVARLISQLHLAEKDVPSLDVAKFHLMRLGAPYVMPRLWSATVKGVSEEDLAKNIKTWATERPALGEYRCGLGLSEGEDGSMTISVLQVDVLAEVAPVPTLVEAGTWIDFSASLLSPTSSASVLLLPPEGLPKHLATQVKNGRATARFAIETKGTWLLQLMATQSGGPRPVAQLMITADAPRPASLDASEVPGESAFDPKAEPSDALFLLMNAARKAQGLPHLRRNRKLDQVARAHSDAMKKTGRISHDTGAGNPAYRIELSGLTPKATGENVAMAANVIRLHRVLWASPAHRENLLLRRWDETGVALSEDENGALFATQLFIDSD